MLSDTEILRRLVHEDPRKRIIISPMISAPEQIGPSSIDVHLGTDFLVVERSDRVQFDALMSKEEYLEWLVHVKSTSRYSVLEQFILHPGEFALGATLEFISLPTTIVAHIDGRSSWARQGLKVHSTAGNIHPGSRGFVVFELENVGPVPIVLYPGLAIAQLTFDEMQGEVLEGYSSRVESRYSGVLEMLWSAYPDDSVLRLMRSLKRHAVEPRDGRQKPSEPSSGPSARTPASQRDALSEADDNLDGIVDALDNFDKGDLQNLIEPVLALTGDDAVDVSAYTERALRAYLCDRCATLHRLDPFSLRAVYRVIMAFSRQKLR